VFIPAPADAPPTLAFIPIPHCFSQHLDFSFGHDLHPSQQHPDVLPTMATAITIIIELTFMDYLTFFYPCRSGTHFRLDGEMILLFQWQYNRELLNFVGTTTKVKNSIFVVSPTYLFTNLCYHTIVLKQQNERRKL
jgi:hypothetical protein